MGDPGDVAAQDRPGPVYDRAVRRVVEADVAGFCALLGVRFDPDDESPADRLLPGTFAGVTRSVDLLVRTGPARLLHVEYQLTAGRGLALRMLGYRAAIMHNHPGAVLDQRVVVLGDGVLDSVDSVDPVGREGFRLGCVPVYLRDMAPAELLSRPALAPLAVLGRGSAQERARVLGTAVREIVRDGGSRTVELLETASVLATIRLDLSTIERIREEAGMTVESMADFYQETDFGQEIRARGRVEGRVEGREEGREEGRDAERVEALVHILRSRFGDRPGVAAAAERLARDAEGATAYHRAATAALEDLVEADSPGPAASKPATGRTAT